MSKYVYVKMVFTALVNRETLEITKSSYSAGSDGVDTTEPYSAGVCKIVEKNTKNKL